MSGCKDSVLVATDADLRAVSVIILKSAISASLEISALWHFGAYHSLAEGNMSMQILFPLQVLYNQHLFFS